MGKQYRSRSSSSSSSSSKKHHKKCNHHFVAILTGSQQVPIVVTKASGEATAELNGNTLKVRGSFKNLESNFNPQIGGHIHLEIAGKNGPVIFPLSIKLDHRKRSGSFKNTFELNNEQVRDLLDRKMYINIHTINHPSGEIRGQILPKANKYFIANLTGAQEYPIQVNTNASGTVVFELNDNNLTASGSFDNLSSPIAYQILNGVHIHKGAAQQDGIVIFEVSLKPDSDNLGATINAQNNVYSLNCEQQKLLDTKGLHIDVHTTQHLTGEIRGQIRKL